MRRETIALVAFLLFLAAFVGQASAVKGPKFDNILIKIYANYTQEDTAYGAGFIDLMDVPLDPTLVTTYTTLPLNATNVVEYFESARGVYRIDINNNETIPSAPGIVQPTSDPWFRVALQYLANKPLILGTTLAGSGATVDTPIPPILGSWVNPSVDKYVYNPTTAATILNAHGYTMGTTWRINPNTGTDMDPLIMYVRADDTIRSTPIATTFAGDLTAAGIPVNQLVVDRWMCDWGVMVLNDYNIYVGPTFDYASFSPICGPSYRPADADYHLTQYASWLTPPSYINVKDSTLDTYLEELKDASTLEEAQSFAYEAQERLMNRPDSSSPGIAYSIPVASVEGYYVYNRALTGVVNMQGEGVPNWWTFLAGRFQTAEIGGMVSWGFMHDVQQLNPLYSRWLQDWYVMDKMYDTLLAVNPYNLVLDMPWMADWEVSAWAGGTLLTFTVYDGITFHDGAPLTLDDVAFTINYIKNYSDSVWYPNVADVDHVDIDSVQRKVYVYMDATSMWALHWIGSLPILPKHLWETITDPTGFIPEPTLTGSGPYTFTEYDPGDHFTLSANRNYFMPTHPSSDLNFDKVTDIFDIINVAASFGKERGQTGFRIIADVAADWDIVDIFDLIVVAANFGTTWVPE